MNSLALVVAVFLVSAGTAIYAAVARRARLLVVTKPLTTLLLFAVTGDAHGAFARLVEVGILLSLVGDVALLVRSERAFLVGLGFFLGAHIVYTAAFIGVARGSLGSPRAIGAAVVLTAATLSLLRALWRGAGGMRAPVAGYAAAISVMVWSAVAASAAAWPSGAAGSSASAAALSLSPGMLGAVGAASFYVSDASLALDRFRKPIANAAFLTLGVYWLGQLGIALAARLAATG